MKKLIAISCLFLFLFITNFTPAQQWTDEQKEVWKTVQAYSDLYALNNLSELYKYFDDSYLGWHYNNPAPYNKANFIKVNNYWGTKEKVVLYRINPLNIWVSGDFAYVHYTFSETDEMNDGKIMTYVGRWTDILMKKDGKWLVVGDHGGVTK